MAAGFLAAVTTCSSQTSGGKSTLNSRTLSYKYMGRNNALMTHNELFFKYDTIIIKSLDARNMFCKASGRLGCQGCIFRKKKSGCIGNERSFFRWAISYFTVTGTSGGFGWLRRRQYGERGRRQTNRPSI